VATIVHNARRKLQIKAVEAGLKFKELPDLDWPEMAPLKKDERKGVRQVVKEIMEQTKIVEAR
jgi:hypothetical protein